MKVLVVDTLRLANRELAENKPAIQITYGRDGTGADEEERPGADKGKGLAVDDDSDGEEPPWASGEDAGPEDGSESRAEDAVEEDWTKYEPPEALNKVPSNASELIREVVKSSIENIRNQIVQEEKLRQEREETEAERRRAQEEEGAEAGTPEPTPPTYRQQQQLPPIVAAPKARLERLERHRRLRPLARFLRHVHSSERGESSAVGAWLYGNGSSSSSSDVTTTTGPSSPSSSKHSGLLAMLRREAAERDRAKDAEKEQTVTFECVSCFEDIPAREAVRAPCHSYCGDCFERLVATAVENEAQWPPKCCLNELPERTVTRHVSRELARRYAARAFEFRVPVEERVYCPHADCGVFVSRSHVSAATRVARCERGHQTCTMCRQPAHGGRGSRCPRDAELQMTENLALEQGWRRCGRCGAFIEHRDACQHMTCRCGAEFCYVCGTPWRGCACSMDDLHALKARARRRREERDAEAAREDAGLAEALRQIEELERDEARRAEERRRAVVAKRYGGERAALAELAHLQDGALRAAHRHDAEALQADTAAARDRLAAKQVSQRAAQRSATELSIRENEFRWSRDYRARLALERALEAAYRAQLAGLWAGRPDRDARDDAAMSVYMRRNDARLDEYARWRRVQLDAFAFRAQEEQAIREELLDRDAALLAEAAVDKARTLAARHAAEATWFDRALAERTRLLAEMEDVERECGGDGGDYVDLDRESVHSLSSTEGED